MTWKFELKKKEIEGVYEIQLEPKEDERGFFMRVYDDKVFRELGIYKEWVQENHSFSSEKGTIRGLHFQYPPDSESKLMRVVTGEIYFTVVDLRKNSRDLGKWTSTIISAEKKNMLLIPRGCATGMCTLTKYCNLLYKVDNYYSQKNEEVIIWNDLELEIKWPIQSPNAISGRDKKGKSFREFIERTGGLEI